MAARKSRSRKRGTTAGKMVGWPSLAKPIKSQIRRRRQKEVFSVWKSYRGISNGGGGSIVIASSPTHNPEKQTSQHLPIRSYTLYFIHADNNGGRKCCDSKVLCYTFTPHE